MEKTKETKEIKDCSLDIDELMHEQVELEADEYIARYEGLL